eukprot:53737-Eustigmatos_ZCMA.PRE.1
MAGFCSSPTPKTDRTCSPKIIADADSWARRSHRRDVYLGCRDGVGGGLSTSAARDGDGGGVEGQTMAGS